MAKGVKTGGRVAGTPNKANAALREMARQYTVEALEALVAVLREGESEQAKISAANAILDRGYGKPSQPVDGDGEGGAIPVAHLIELIGVRPGEG